MIEMTVLIEAIETIIGSDAAFSRAPLDHVPRAHCARAGLVNPLFNSIFVPICYSAFAIDFSFKA